MKLVFISNYYNHHQSEISKCFLSITNGEYTFIATVPMDSERVTMGWAIECPPYVVQYNDNTRECDEMILSADVVIIGAAPIRLVKKRLKCKKLVFMYTERPYRNGVNIVRSIQYFIQNYLFYGRFSSLYCLCASAFTSADYNRTHTFINKTYKWGYFPEVVRYDIDDIIAKKNKKEVRLLFVSRMITLKHPEYPVLAAKRLKDEGVSFQMTMIGKGEKEKEIIDMINDMQVADVVIFKNEAMPPESVREYMLEANIFLFTSDKQEGWGAVMNESMNSGCAVIASSKIGSVPFLINDGINGCIYRDGNFDDFYIKLKMLCLDKVKREQMGINAYKTMTDIWNAEVATQRLMLLIKDINLNGYSDRYLEGPCSKASVLRDDWY